MDSFANRFTKALELKNITAAELSRILGLNEGTISNYKKGNYEPKQRRLEAIAKALDVSIAWLMGADVPMKRTDTLAQADNIIPLPKTKKVPLLGTIACGEPILAEENIEDYLGIDEKVNVDFALRCKGDSMINARIFDGDIVYIKQQSDVDDGEIAAVLIGDEATLKKIYKYENKVVLRPCNPMYDDLVYAGKQLNELRILGKAIMFTSMVRHGK